RQVVQRRPGLVRSPARFGRRLLDHARVLFAGLTPRGLCALGARGLHLGWHGLARLLAGSNLAGRTNSAQERPELAFGRLNKRRAGGANSWSVTPGASYDCNLGNLAGDDGPTAPQEALSLT